MGCGGSDSSSSSSGETKAAAAPPTGEVEVRWQEPASEADELGDEMLKASETEMLAKTLAETFQLPNPLTVKGVNGIGGGPFYTPKTTRSPCPTGLQP